MSGTIEKVDALKLAVDNICVFEKARTHKLLRSLRVWRVCINMILEQGKLLQSDKGTPQGGIISPVLGNIYLHFVLDDWFEKVVEKGTKGYAATKCKISRTLQILWNNR